MGGCSSNQSGSTPSKSRSGKQTDTNKRTAPIPKKKEVFRKEDYSTGSDSITEVIIETGRDESAVTSILSNYPHPYPPNQVKQKDIWYDDDEFNEAIDELDVLKEEFVEDPEYSMSDNAEVNNNLNDPLDALDFIVLDDHAKRAGSKENASFDKLFEYLYEPIKGKQYQKLLTARAILIWMNSQNIEKSNFGKPNRQSPSGLLQMVKDKNLTYASCYTIMCRKAKLKCVKIQGYVKTTDYEPGNDVIAESTWTAVFVENGWQIVHPYWYCRPIYGTKLGGWAKADSDNEPNFKRQTGGVIKDVFHERYFMPDPEEFIHECCAIDPKWQLVKPSLSVTSLEQFLDMPYLRAPFFGLGFRLKSKPASVLTTKHGSCKVVLKSQMQNSHMLLLYYDLRKIDTVGVSDIHMNGVNTPGRINTPKENVKPTPRTSTATNMPAKTQAPRGQTKMTNSMDTKRIETRNDMNEQQRENTTNDMDVDVTKMVLNSRAGRQFTFDFRFPQTGEYKLVIYGGPLNTPALRLCEFKIVCKKEIKDRLLLPVSCANVGFGPGPLSLNAGLFLPSRPSGIINVDIKATKTVEIKFRVLRKKQTYSAYMKATLNTNEIEQFDECLDIKTTEDRHLLITATLPREGEFVVMINQVNKGSNSEVNVCNYLLTTLEGGTQTRANERYAKRKLEETMAEEVVPEGWKKKLTSVEKLWENCKREHVPTSDEFMLRTSEEIDFLRCKDKLRDCKLRRNPFFIRRTLAIVENYKNTPLVSKEVEIVNQLIKEVESEELLRQDEEKRDPKITKAQRTILKIHYPTKEMFDVIKALFLLVGEPIRETMEWRYIQSRFRENGVMENNVPDKIARIRPRYINHDRRRKAQRFVEQYDDNTIRKVSEGIFILFEWVNKTLKEQK